jgi:hypothetical protein
MAAFGCCCADDCPLSQRSPKASLGVVGREIGQGVRGHQSSDASTSDYHPAVSRSTERRTHEPPHRKAIQRGHPSDPRLQGDRVT